MKQREKIVLIGFGVIMLSLTLLRVYLINHTVDVINELTVVHGQLQKERAINSDLRMEILIRQSLTWIRAWAHQEGFVPMTESQEYWLK